MKKLTDKQKKIINIVVTSLQICIVILAITVSAIVLANPRMESSTVGKGSVKLLPVLTNSMEGNNKDSFSEGDLVVAGKPKDASKLEVGDIITYKFRLSPDGKDRLNTHRIYKKLTNEKGEVYFQTKGDAAAENDPDEGFVLASEVLAVYKYHLKGVGAAINKLQQPTNFLLIIVLPLALLFIYNIVLFVRMIMQAKLNKVKAENASLAIDEEEVKRRAIEEYLAKQAAQNGATGETGDKDEEA